VSAQALGRGASGHAHETWVEDDRGRCGMDSGRLPAGLQKELLQCSKKVLTTGSSPL